MIRTDPRQGMGRVPHPACPVAVSRTAGRRQKVAPQVLPVVAFLLLAVPFAQALEPYARKPLWWEDTPLPEKADDVNVIWAELEKQFLKLRSPASSWVVGPFNGALPESLSLVFPPEDDARPDAEFAAPGGGTLRWQLWEEGSDCPIDVSKGTAVVYQRCDIAVAEACTTFLAISAPGTNAAVWLDGKRILFKDQWHREYQDRSLVLPLTLNAGPHRVLIKFHRHDSRQWRFYARVFDRNPYAGSARLRTAFIFGKLKAGTEEKDLASHAWELARDYLGMGDFENAGHWGKYGITITTNGRFSRDLLRHLNHYAQNARQFIPMTSLAQWAFEHVTDDEPREEALKLWLQGLFQQYRPKEALRVADSLIAQAEGPCLERLLHSRIRALIWLSDSSGARAARQTYLEAYPQARKDGNVREFLRGVDVLREGVSKVAREYELRANTLQAEKLAAEGNRRALLGFIRKLLAERSMHLIQTDDQELFGGAGDAYRDAFAPHVEEYQTHWQELTALMERRLQASPASIARGQRQIHLRRVRATPPVMSVPANGEEGSEALSSDLLTVVDALRPVTFLRYSAVELQAIEADGTKRVSRPAVPWATRLGDRTFVQSSRHVVSLAGGKVAWDLCLPPSRLLLETDREKTHVVSDAPRPVAVGESLYVRLLDRGRFSLLCLDAQTGALRWRFAPADRFLCSDPVVTQTDVIVIARRDAGMRDYHLLLIDRESGSLQNELYLYSAEPQLRLHRDYADYVQLDHDVPPPTIVDGTAYICTNVGVLTAVDVDRNTVRWARTYPRLPFSVDTRLSRLVLNRRPSPPVVGETCVLFAPMDHLSPLLLDRENGRLVSAKGTAEWRCVSRLDTDTALWVGARGKTLILVSLTDLAEMATVEGVAEWVILSTAGGRALVQCGEDIGTVDSQGAYTRLGRVPSAVGRLCPGSAGEWLVARPEEDAYAILAPSSSPEDAHLEPTFRSEKEAPYLINPSPRQVGEHRLLIAENAVVKLDEQRCPAWVHPIWQEPEHIIAVGTTVALISNRRLRLLDGDTGITLKAYPPLGAHLRRISAAAGVGKDVLLAAWYDWGTTTVVRWNADGPTSVGVANNVDHVGALFQDGQRLIGHRQGQARVHELDPTHGQYVAREEQFAGDSAVFLGGDRIALLKHRHSIGLLAGDTLVDVPLKKGQTEWRWQKPWVKDGILAVRYFRDYLTVVDTHAGKDLGLMHRFLARPFVADGQVLGIAWPEGSPALAAVWYDSRTQQHHSEELPGDDVEDWQRYKRDMRAEFSFRRKGAIYHVLKPRHDPQRSLERVLAIQTVRDHTIRLRRVAGFGSGSMGLSTPDGVVLGIDDKLLRLDQEAFTAWVEAPYAARGRRDSKFECTVDGFPDEWDADHLTTYGRWSIAGCLKGDMAYVLLAVHDPALVAAIVREPDFMSRLQLMACPGGMLGLESEAVYREEYVGALSRPAVEDWQVDFHVPPTGDALFIEAGLPLSSLLGRTTDELRQVGSRGALGDLAFNLLLPGPDGARRGLLAPLDRAAEHPRIVFERP